MKTYFRFLLSLTAAFGILLSAVAETVPVGLTDLTEPVQANVSTSVSTFFDGSGPFYAFDNNENDRVMSTGTDPFDIIYTFGQGTVVNAYSVQMVAGNYRSSTQRDAKTWTFEGSEDGGTTWDVLDERDETTTWGSLERRFYQFTNKKAYTKYRIRVTNNFGNHTLDYGDFVYTHIGEIEFYKVKTDDRQRLTTDMCEKKLTFTCAGVPEGVDLADFPVLVRLSSAINGFSYDQFKQDDLADLLFVDAEGNELAYEIDTWNPAGVSSIWVKMAKLVPNATFTMFYSAEDAKVENDPTAVWTNYTAVWHFASDASKDASGHALNAVLSDKSKASDALIGRGFTNTRAICDLPDAKMGVGSPLTLSGWINPSANSVTCRFISTKGNGAHTGKGLEFMFVSGTGLYTRGDGGSAQAKWAASNDTVYPKNTWHYYSTTLDGTTAKIYFDGEEKVSGTIVAVTDHGTPTLGFGGCGGGQDSNLATATLDELRIYKGAASATWLRQEYLSVHDAQYVTAGAVENAMEGAPVLANPRLTRTVDGDYVVSVDLIEGPLTADYYVIAADSDGNTVRANVAFPGGDYPQTGTATLTGLAANTTYQYVVWGVASERAKVSVRGAETFYTGELTVVWESDAREEGLTHGSFSVRRADYGEALVVNYTVGGTATPDEAYEALSGTVTIPAGTSRVTVEVTPKVAASVREDQTVVVSLADGFYGVPESASATVTIVNLPLPDGYKIWVAKEAANASEASSWSDGTVPTAADNILFDGRFSRANCTWDAAASQTVAGLIATNGYAGTITVATTLNETFPVFTVTGDVWNDCASLVPVKHAQDTTTAAYWFNLAVGGSLTLKKTSDSVIGKIAATERGLYSAYYDTVQGYSVHAGYAGYIENGLLESRTGTPVGSIFEPTVVAQGVRNGERNQENKNAYGGGAIHVVVAGDFVNNGAVGANGGQSSMGAGAGGSIYIKAKSITGSGSFAASGKGGTKTDSTSSVASGGRIALVATDGVCAPTGNLTVDGSFDGHKNGTSSAATYQAGAPGTIYLEDVNQKVVRVKGLGANHASNYLTTPIPVLADEAARLKDVTLSVEKYGRASLTQDKLTMATLRFAGENNRLDLAGKTLKVKTAYVGETKLKPGTYTVAAKTDGTNYAESENCKCLINSAEAPGTLIVGDGIVFIVR